MTNIEVIRQMTEEGLINLIYSLTEGEIKWCRTSKCKTAALDGFYAEDCDWCVHKWLNADAEGANGLLGDSDKKRHNWMEAENE